MSQSPGTTTRNTLYVAIAVTVFLAIAIGVSAARGPVEPATGAGGSEVATGEPGGETGGAATGGAQGGTDGGANTGGAAGGGTSPSTGGEGAEVPVAPDAPTKPAAEGSRLTTLSAPPAKTIGMIKLPEKFTEATFVVTFKPYGWGPSGAAGGRLVAEITESRPNGEAATALDRDFVGRNATLWCSEVVAKSIRMGGTYTGAMVVKRQGDVGILFIENVKAVE